MTDNNNNFNMWITTFGVESMHKPCYFLAVFMVTWSQNQHPVDKYNNEDH